MIMSDQETELNELLKQPISTDCYMIAKSWWEQWVDFIKSKDKPEPGIIYNIDLV